MVCIESENKTAEVDEEDILVITGLNTDDKFIVEAVDERVVVETVDELA